MLCRLIDLQEEGQDEIREDKGEGEGDEGDGYEKEIQQVPELVNMDLETFITQHLGLDNSYLDMVKQHGIIDLNDFLLNRDNEEFMKIFIEEINDDETIDDPSGIIAKLQDAVMSMGE